MAEPWSSYLEQLYRGDFPENWMQCMIKKAKCTMLMQTENSKFKKNLEILILILSEFFYSAHNK